MASDYLVGVTTLVKGNKKYQCIFELTAKEFNKLEEKEDTSFNCIQ